MFRGFCAALCAVIVSGCFAEVAKFSPQIGQEAIVRDGVPAMVSRKPYSIVMLRPAKRQFQAGARPSYVLAIFNPTNRPLNFTLVAVGVDQYKDGAPVRSLRVYSYDDLLKEEQTRQFVGALLLVTAAAANSYSASRQGYYNANATVSGPGGISTIHVSGYSPVANAIAQDRAAAQNDAMISSAIEQGQQNMAVLEQVIIKDNTIMPGEWYGGQLIFDAPQNEGGKNFKITVQLGPDRHELNVSQVDPGT
jgi:hypothetical protein